MEKIQAILVLQRILAAVLETVGEAGQEGAPASPLFLAMQAHGATRAQFDEVMASLVQGGYLRVKSGDCYTITPAGAELRQKLAAVPA